MSAAQEPDETDPTLEELALRCAAAFLSIAEQSSPRAAYAQVATQRSRLDRSWYELAHEILANCGGLPLEECLYDTGTDVHPALSVTDLQNCAMLAAAYWSTRGGISMHDALNRLVLGVRPLNPYWGQLLAQVADRLMDDMSTKIERIVGPGKPPAKPPERPTWVHFDAYSRGR